MRERERRGLCFGDGGLWRKKKKKRDEEEGGERFEVDLVFFFSAFI